MYEFIQYLANNEPLALLSEDPHRLAKTYRMRDEDICETHAMKRIRNHSDLLNYMSAAYFLRAHGNRKQIKLAGRIDKLCQLHPEFGKSAIAVQAQMALERIKT